MGADTTEKKSGFRLFEKGCGFRAGAKDLLKYTNGSTLSSAIIYYFWLHRSLSRDDCGLRGGWLYHGRDCVLDFWNICFRRIIGGNYVALL